MSATLESNKIYQYFVDQGLKVISLFVPGRYHPIEIYNLNTPTLDYIEEAAEMTLRIHFEYPEGDVLVFLTGQEEIEKCITIIERRIEKFRNLFVEKPLHVIALFANLSLVKQNEVFSKLDDKRKAIISTNIAETALTIPGLRYVVDCGFVKIRVFNHEKNIDSLVVVTESRASALQRAGRAGREGLGKCFQLFPRNIFDCLEPFSVPEILRTNHLWLVLFIRGLNLNPYKLNFLDPITSNMESSHLILNQMGALSKEWLITPLGKILLEFPLDPYSAFCMFNTIKESVDIQSHIATILAVQAADPIFFFYKNNFQDAKKIINNMVFNNSDHLAKIIIFNKFIQVRNKDDFCKSLCLRRKALETAEKIRNQLLDKLNKIKQSSSSFLFQQKKENFSFSQGVTASPDVSKLDFEKIIFIMKSSFFNNIAEKQTSNIYNIGKSNTIVKIHPQSLLYNLKIKPKRVLFSSVTTTTSTFIQDLTELIN